MLNNSPIVVSEESIQLLIYTGFGSFILTSLGNFIPFQGHYSIRSRGRGRSASKVNHEQDIYRLQLLK